MGFQAATITSSLYLSLILLLAAPPTTALYEWIPPGIVCDSIHDYTPVPFEGVPPPMPKLPNQYTMHVQANILQKSWSSNVVEHYDGPNNKAAVFLTFNGSTTQTIFNFDNKETYDVYPDGTCKARAGRSDYFGFFKMDRNNRPMKSTVYEMFHMGHKQNFTYVGDTWVRGIRVNHWTSCQEWQDWGARFQLDYYFTHEEYQTAWGMGQIPLRAVVNGSAGNEDQNHGHMRGRHKFEHIYDFTSINVGPIQDQTVFNLPHQVVCTGRTDHKNMPDMPDNFQMDMEMMSPALGNSIPIQQSLRYDWEHRLVETFMNVPTPQGTMADMKRKMDQMKESARDGSDDTADMQRMMDMDKLIMRSLSTIDDHSTGLRYFTEKMNNTCKVTQMPTTEEDNPMDHGRSLFSMHLGQKTGNSPFTYQGRSMFRNMPVEVWGVDSDGMVQKVFFLADEMDDHFAEKGEAGGQQPDGDMSKQDWGSMSDSGNNHWSHDKNKNNNNMPVSEPSPGTSSPNNKNNKPNMPMGPMSGGGGGGNPMSGMMNNRPTPGPNSNGRSPTHPMLNKFRPTGAPGAAGPMQGGGGGGNQPAWMNSMQNQMNDAREKAKEKAKENSRPTGGPMQGENQPAWMGAMQNQMQIAKEKAKEKAKENAKPTGKPNSGNQANWMNAVQKFMPTGKPGTENEGQQMSAQDMLDKIKERREKGKQDDNKGSMMPSTGGVMPKRRKNSPFPVLVGMMFRNRTAISTRNMPAFFQQVMTPEIMKWKENMEKQLVDTQKTEGSHMIDVHEKMDKMNAKLMRQAGEMDMNVFHFQPLHTDQSMFQVSQCYSPDQKSNVLLHVPTPFQQNVQNNQGAFSIAMRKGIAEAMGVSYLHVSELKPEPHIDREKNIDGTYVSFSLLGSPPIKAPKVKQPSISEAKRRLVQAIKNGISFKVKYPTHTKSFLVDRDYYSLDHKMFQNTMRGGEKVATGHKQSSSNADGYSSATVAGIAIATLLIGFVVAAAAIILLYKRKHPEEPVIPYKITKA